MDELSTRFTVSNVNFGTLFTYEYVGFRILVELWFPAITNDISKKWRTLKINEINIFLRNVLLFNMGIGDYDGKLMGSTVHISELPCKSRPYGTCMELPRLPHVVERM